MSILRSRNRHDALDKKERRMDKMGQMEKIELEEYCSLLEEENEKLEAENKRLNHLLFVILTELEKVRDKLRGEK